MAGLINWKDAQKVIRHELAARKQHSADIAPPKVQTRQPAAKQPRQTNPGREIEAYRYIVAYKAKHDGNSPPMREICNAIGIASTNTVSGYLDKLIDAGMITKQRGNISIVGAKWTPPEAL